MYLSEIQCQNGHGDGVQERLTDTDDPVRNGVRAMVVHVLLLFVKRADHRKPVMFPYGKGSSHQGRVKGQSGVVIARIAAEILQIS